MEERQDVMFEEGLHQTVMFILSHGALDLKVLRSILLKHLGTKGNCLIGLLTPRQILLRFNQYEDYVIVLSRLVNYLLYNGEEHQCREETTLAVIWISLPNLSPDLFAKKSLLSIASAIGKPIAIDKATQIKSRPSTSRVKVILDLMEKLPNSIRLQFVDEKSGKLIEVFQEIVYDNLLLYCNYCKHQGHDEHSCCLILKRNQNNKQIDATIEVALKSITDSEKYQGDVREILNEKRKTVDVDQSKTTSLDRQLVASTSEQNRVDSMDVDTSNIGVQTTIENKSDCNNQQAATNEVQSKEVGLNLMSNATKNAEETPRVRVDAPRVGSGQKLMDLGLKLMDTSDVETLVTYKKSTSSRILSLTSQNNSPCSEKGPTENFNDSEKRQDTSNASRDLLCSNNFDALLKTTGKQKLSVAREEDISPRQQRSGSNKSKKKTHERKHSWDGKMTKEFVPRHLPMQQAMQNYLTVSIGSTRSNKSINKKKTREKYFKLLLMGNQSFLIHAFVIESLRLVVEVRYFIRIIRLLGTV
ncbi:hypothetical protein H5410_038976 [Solanum commersonii]|uniref:DUF4283 domain-containing protein n=1 Tax=Solanum commersonii TaxID=4109 RepID=A0A9J5YDS9_SOLCO|nr:hypothetical protein H5410_038976 [Solanum commersonii]